MAQTRNRQTVSKLKADDHFFETQQSFVKWLRNSQQEKYTKRHAVDGSSPVDWALAKEAKKIKMDYDHFFATTFPVTSDDTCCSSESEEEEYDACWWKEGKKKHKLVRF